MLEHKETYKNSNNWNIMIDKGNFMQGMKVYQALGKLSKILDDRGTAMSNGRPSSTRFGSTAIGEEDKVLLDEFLYSTNK